MCAFQANESRGSAVVAAASVFSDFCATSGNMWQVSAVKCHSSHCNSTESKQHNMDLISISDYGHNA